MKNLFAFLILFICTGYLKAQSVNPENIKNIRLDLLSTATNPAFIIMGASPSEITEPSATCDFYAGIQNASSNFTILPNNLGLTIAPCLLTKASKNLSFDDDFSTQNKLYFWRYLRISAGVLKGVNDNDDMWRYGLGLQTNLFAGKVDKYLKDQCYSRLKSYNYAFYDSFEEFINADPLYIDLTNEYNELVNKLKDSGGTDNLLKSEISRVDKRRTMLKKSLAQEFDLLNRVGLDSLNLNKMFSELEKRIGFKWDFGFGVACDILNHEIVYADINKLGAWTNFGYTLPIHGWNSYLSFLGLGRYLNYEDYEYGLSDTTYYATNHQGMVDVGGQLKIEIANKLTLLAEGVYRTILDDRTEPTYRLNGLVQYKFWKYQIVFFSFGNAFNIKNNKGLLDTQLNFGVNLGIGNNVDISF